MTPSPVKVRAVPLGLPIFQPERLRDDAFVDAMAELDADVFVVVAFRILPKKLYSLPKYGSINVHASLLPKYRGAAPINHALLNGESETGLTSFFLTKQVDGGDVIDQVSTPIDPDENYSSLYARLSEMSGPFLLDTLDKIIRPGFAPQKQDMSRATPAPKIGSEDGLIDWTRPDGEVHNHIRAFSEQPGAFSFIGEQKIKILGSRREDTGGLPHLEPGEMHIHRKRLWTGTGSGPIRLTRLQPEGKKAMDALAFINGYRIESHQTFLSRRKEVRQ